MGIFEYVAVLTSIIIGLGIAHHVASVLQPTLCIVAMFTRNPRFHGAFALTMLIHQASWAVRQYWMVA